MSGRRRGRRPGNAGCRGSPAIADGIGALIGAAAGSVFLGPNVSVLQAAIASCIDFRGTRNEVVYESLQFPSLTYVWREWQRYGAAVARRRVAGRTNGSHRTRRRRDHREDRDRSDLARVLCLRCAGGRRRNRRALPRRRRPALRRRVSDDRGLSVRRRRTRSRPRHRRLAQVAVRRPGLRLDLLKPALRESFGPRSRDGWRTSGPSRSNRRRSCTPRRCIGSATAPRRSRDMSSRRRDTR